jgi:hypothetical protein
MRLTEAPRYEGENLFFVDLGRFHEAGDGPQLHILGSLVDMPVPLVEAVPWQTVSLEYENRQGGRFYHMHTGSGWSSPLGVGYRVLGFEVGTEPPHKDPGFVGINSFVRTGELTDQYYFRPGDMLFMRHAEEGREAPPVVLEATRRLPGRPRRDPDDYMLEADMTGTGRLLTIGEGAGAIREAIELAVATRKAKTEADRRNIRQQLAGRTLSQAIHASPVARAYLGLYAERFGDDYAAA